MKTLILFGSPRQDGDTAFLTGMLREGLEGEIYTVDAYGEDISPCVDCRFCRAHYGCALKDGMDRVYDLVRECDNAVIASPIYFAGLTGRTLDVASRLQTFFSAARFRGEDARLKPKKGGIILTGGGSGGADRAAYTARLILRHVNCREIFPPVCSLKTDTVPARRDRDAAEGIKAMAEFLNVR